MGAEIRVNNRVKKLTGIVGISGYDFCPTMVATISNKSRLELYGEGLPLEMFLNEFEVLVLNGMAYIPESWKISILHPKTVILRSGELGYLMYNGHIESILGLDNQRFLLTSLYPTKEKRLEMGVGCRWPSYEIQNQFFVRAI